MMFRFILVHVILFAALCVQGARFGDVTVEMLPALSRHSFSWYFRTVNHSRENAGITFRLIDAVNFRLSVEKSIVLPPGGSRVVDIPVSYFNDTYNNLTLFLKINGKNYDTEITHGLSYSGAMHCVLIAAEADSESVLTSLIFNVMGGRSDYVETVLETGLWRADLREYSSYRVIVLDSEHMPPPETVKVLEDYAAMGGMVIVRAAPDSPWPERVPGEKKDYHRRSIGLGEWITVREPSGKEASDYVKAVQNEKKRNRWNMSKVKIPASFGGMKKLNGRFALRNPRLSEAYPSPKVPMGAMVVVMGLFILFIGPVNYLVLRRKKREMLLLVTVPVISLTFCLLVIGYITFSEGWHSRGKARGVTFLDQNSGRAVTFAAMSYYTPLPVRGGFRFDSDEIVRVTKAEQIEVNLDRGQLLDSSLLRPRLPVSINVESVRRIREKVRITILNKDAVEAVNGLGAPLTGLTVTAPDGTVFVYPGKIQPGEKVVLTGKKGKTRDRELKSYHMNRDFSAPPGYYRADMAQAHFYSTGIKADEFTATHTVVGKY